MCPGARRRDAVAHDDPRHPAPSDPDPRGPGPGGALTLAVVAGLTAGALTSFGQTLLPGPLGGLANAVSPWLVVPFVTGAATRRWSWALAAGAVACLAQVAGYYVTADLRGFPSSTTWVVFWLLCGLPGGLVTACRWGAAGWGA